MSSSIDRLRDKVAELEAVHDHLTRTVVEQLERIGQLENAIRKHRDTVATLLAVFEGDDRAETCEEDNQLWAVLGGDDVN